jgi:EpsI family protein
MFRRKADDRRLLSLNNRTYLGIAVALAAIVAGEVAIRAMGSSFMSVPAQRPAKSLTELPKSLGDWTASDSPLDADLVRNTGADEMTNWNYRNSAGDVVEMNAGMWLNYEIAIPHKAEICYPGAGWELAGREVVQVPLDETTHTFPAKLLTFEKNSQRIAVMYWVQFGDQIALDDDDVRRVLQRAMRAGRPRPAAIKCMLQTSAAHLDLAKDRLRSFAGMVAGHLKELQ